MALAGQIPLTIYPLADYTFGSKESKREKHATLEQKLSRLQEQYTKEGVRRSVEGILIVHEHGHPHLLLLKSGSQLFRLPGGRLRPGEDVIADFVSAEIEGLQRKLTTALSPSAKAIAVEWQIGDCVATYWRPHFEPNMYPYLPVHITRPKEVRKLYVVHLPERCYFAVPKNLELVAMPLYECYEGVSRFGATIAALPHLLSRFRLTIVGQQRLLQLPAPGEKGDD